MATTVSGSTVAAPSTAVDTLPEALNASRTHVSAKDEEYTVDELIVRYSALYGVSASTMRAVIKCESNFNPNAVGDGGHSRGLVQIHDQYWPEVTDEMAFDPEFAVEFLAKNLAIHNGKIWTCWRNLVQ